MTDAFLHRFVAGDGTPGPVLLLLHGTGGTEDDLLPLGRALAPGAPQLSPRGRVLERGMARFFRRFTEGVFDEDSLRAEAAALAAWIPAAAEAHGVADRPVVAVGFSNGANIAAALLLLHPGVLRGAVLIRGMVPLERDLPPASGAAEVLLLSGEHDPMVPLDNPRRLAGLLRSRGVAVQHDELPASHALSRDDVDRAGRWLAARRAAFSGPPAGS